MTVCYVTVDHRGVCQVRDASGAVVAEHARQDRAEEDAYQRNFGAKPPTPCPQFFDVEIGQREATS